MLHKYISTSGLFAVSVNFRFISHVVRLQTSRTNEFILFSINREIEDREGKNANPTKTRFEFVFRVDVVKFE